MTNTRVGSTFTTHDNICFIQRVVTVERKAISINRMQPIVKISERNIENTFFNTFCNLVKAENKKMPPKTIFIFVSLPHPVSRSVTGTIAV